jgi:hypothetical protein
VKRSELNRWSEYLYLVTTHAWEDVEEKVPTSNSTIVLPSLKSTNSVNKWPSLWAGEFFVLLERNLNDGLKISSKM